MIKFFKKIRQNLLSEGKTGKYLKYAIGEIFLVVIGILIALQVNNWNQEKASERGEKMLIEQFIIDLESDAFRINKALENSKNKREISQYYYNEINNIESPSDSVNLNGLTSAPRVPISFKSKNQKFVDQIDDKDLYNILIEYMYLEKNYLEGLTWTNSFIRNNVRNYLGDNKAFNLNEIFGEKSIPEILSESGLMHDEEQFQKLYNDGEFHNILFNTRMQSYINIKEANLLLANNKKLRKELAMKIK